MTVEEKIPTNLRMLHIMEVLGQADRPITATEINDKIGLPKQTMHRLCNTLVEQGFLVREGNSKRLRPARRLRSLASGLVHASRFHIARHQVLTQVATEVGETVNFVVPQDTGMTYLDRVETDWAFRVQLPIGTAVPFHCTASGKTFLASLTPPRRRAMLESLDLQPLTDNTLSTVPALLDELKRVSKQGYALDNEEFIADMVAIAVPVLDPNGQYVAALAYHGPLPRMDLSSAVRNVDLLHRAAERLSAAIFA